MDDLSDPGRLEPYRPDEIVQSLQILRDQRILDIGAGTGEFTVRFARALKGSGEVVATDVEPALIEHIRQRADSLRHNNITVVQVSPDGVDPFYTVNRFDKIFLCSVYEEIGHPETYFRNLRPSLEETTGRLYIVYPNTTPHFFERDLENAGAVLQALAKEEARFPVRLRLSPDLEAVVERGPTQEVSLETKQALLDDLNRMLLVRELLPELQAYFDQKYSRERIETIGSVHYRGIDMIPGLAERDRSLVTWLIERLAEQDVFKNTQRPLPRDDTFRLMTLNEILLAAMLLPDRPRGPNKKGFLRIEDVIDRFERVGYEHLNTHLSLSDYPVLEFKAVP